MFKNRHFRKAQADLKKAEAGSRKAQVVSKKAKALSKKAQTVSFSKELVVKDIVKEARTIDIAPAAAERFAKIVAEKVSKWAEGRGNITQNDLNIQIAREIERFNSDLSFVYKNRGKII